MAATILVLAAASAGAQSYLVRKAVRGTTGIPSTPRHCKDVRDLGAAAGNKLYTIDPDGAGGAAAFPAWCDMSTDGGGWTLVLSNIGNVSGSLRFGSGARPLTPSVHGAHALSIFLNGSRELRWASGASLILKVQENGTQAAYVTIPAQGSNNCPSIATRYAWTVLVTDAGWMNAHTTGGIRCPGWNDSGAGVWNHFAGADCGVCYSPAEVLFGNGASGYYGWGNLYDFDYLNWNGVAQMNDVVPSFYSPTMNHQLWIR